MEQALVTLIIAVVVLGGVVALYTVATSASAYREIGKGGIDVPVADDPPPEPAVPDDRDEEIRELLEARNARRARRGEPPLDVEAQIAALANGGGGGLLAAGAGAGELHDEVRALVEARNRRRQRAGLAPLDVDTEIARRLRELN